LGVVAVVSRSDGKAATIVVGVTPDLTDRFDAVESVRPGADALGGRGGGRAGMVRWAVRKLRAPMRHWWPWSRQSQPRDEPRPIRLVRFAQRAQVRLRMPRIGQNFSALEILTRL